MNKYVFDKKETLQRTVVIEAENEKVAAGALKSAYDNERIVLDYNDYAGCEIKNTTDDWMDQDTRELYADGFDRYVELAGNLIKNSRCYFIEKKMIAVVISLVVHAVLTLGVFGFTYGMYVATQELNMLHLLWLLLAVW